MIGGMFACKCIKQAQEGALATTKESIFCYTKISPIREQIAGDITEIK
jgi:hypothetical protein